MSGRLQHAHHRYRARGHEWLPESGMWLTTSVSTGRGQRSTTWAIDASGYGRRPRGSRIPACPARYGGSWTVMARSSQCVHEGLTDPRYGPSGRVSGDEAAAGRTRWPLTILGAARLPRRRRPRQCRHDRHNDTLRGSNRPISQSCPARRRFVSRTRPDIRGSSW